MFNDSKGHLALPGAAPVFDPSKRPQTSMVHVTSVSPAVTEFETVLALHTEFREQALSNPDVHAVLTRDDLDRKHSMGILFGLQNPPEGLNIHKIKKLYDAGIRVMAIAHDHGNEYGSGFENPECGLTRRGEDLIRRCGEVGIIVDISNSGRKTAEAALWLIATRKKLSEISPGVMASHSGCTVIHHNLRNLSEKAIQMLCFNKGYMGIPATSFLISRPDVSPLESFRRHVMHAVSMCQDDEMVGIGSDCPHIDMTMQEAEELFNSTAALQKPYSRIGGYFPDRPSQLILHGSTMFDTFKETLHGLPFDLRGVLGGNFRSFLKRSLPA